MKNLLITLFAVSALGFVARGYEHDPREIQNLSDPYACAELRIDASDSFQLIVAHDPMAPIGLIRPGYVYCWTNLKGTGPVYKNPSIWTNLEVPVKLNYGGTITVDRKMGIVIIELQESVTAVDGSIAVKLSLANGRFPIRSITTETPILSK